MLVCCGEGEDEEACYAEGEDDEVGDVFHCRRDLDDFCFFSLKPLVVIIGVAISGQC